MKKILLSTIGGLLITSAKSQAIFGSGGSKMQSEIEAWFPYVIAIAFLIGGGVAIGYLIGENRDIKKFILALVFMVLGIGAIVAGYTYIKSLSL